VRKNNIPKMPAPANRMASMELTPGAVEYDPEWQQRMDYPCLNDVEGGKEKHAQDQEADGEMIAPSRGLGV
jgi:hypothetical protein